MTRDKLALGITVSGILVAVAVALTGNLLGRNWVPIAGYAFAGLQVVAIVVGASAWRMPLGKAAVAASACLLAGLFLFV